MSDALAQAAALLALLQACHRIRPGLVSATVERVGCARTTLASDFAARDRDELRVRELARSARVGDDLEERLAAWAEAGLHPITVLDPDYPCNLRPLADRPPLLWRRGALRPEHAWALAVVGTRAPTLRGCDQTRRLTTALARVGVTVVSGLAAGIDTAAHHSALTAGGRTLAVLGHGLARPVYPPENAALAAAIAAHDALLSPFLPDAPPAPATFRARNAITSGLALGTLVVEAGPRSGARLQARLAAEQGRPVFLLRSLYHHEPWARAFAETHPVRVVEHVDDVLATLAACPPPSAGLTAPARDPEQLSFPDTRTME